MSLVDVVAALATANVTWEDFRWIRKAWPGPLVAKGVLTGEDARRAIDRRRDGRRGIESRRSSARRRAPRRSVPCPKWSLR